VVAVEVTDVVGAGRLERRIDDIVKEPESRIRGSVEPPEGFDVTGLRDHHRYVRPRQTLSVCHQLREVGTKHLYPIDAGKIESLREPSPTANVAPHLAEQTDANRSGESPPLATPRFPLRVPDLSRFGP
jgi:hypothetical protein